MTYIRSQTIMKYCIIRLTKSILNILELITSDPSIYKLDHPDFILSPAKHGRHIVIISLSVLSSSMSLSTE